MFSISAGAGAPESKQRRIWMIAILIVCSISTVAGFAAMYKFDQTAGAVSDVPVQWPASTVLEGPATHGSLLVFVHPYCSCTVATVHELATLHADRKSPGERPAMTILFYRPANSAWKQGKLWDSARHDLPGARIIWDDGGREARRFGACTSGYALLYGARGNLLFKGGVTGSRGHEGDNFGIDELRTSIDTGRPAHRSSLVFGCDFASLDPLSKGDSQ
jgi:hypothetical protein